MVEEARGGRWRGVEDVPLGEVVASRGGRLSEDVSFKGGSTLLSEDGEDVPF